MNELPVSVHPALRRLSRRLAIGLFLQHWPVWAVPSLLAAGVVAVICRLFVPAAAAGLPWLWLAPVAAAVPALLVRRYRPAEVVAIADWLSGGHGLLLTLHETHDRAWAGSLERASRFPLPRLRPWRRLAPLVPAAAFLVVALWLPQRTRAAGSNAIVADEIASELSATVEELKQQALVSPAEEEKLEEAIERIRRGAEERVDASSWEAADAFRERLIAELSAKQDALEWAEASLARLDAATPGQGGESAGPPAAELTAALEKLAKSGLMSKAPPELQRLLKGGKPPGDAASLKQLTASLSKYLAEARGRLGDVAKLGKEFGRFDPAEFPIASQPSPDGDGNPGSGNINRGRGDAPLTWGKESQPVDRFTAQPLPPGAGRADDWTPVVELPGAPQESPVLSTAAAARQYGASAGQAAWRRTLAPRHQSAVKKYFAK